MGRVDRRDSVPSHASAHRAADVDQSPWTDQESGTDGTGPRAGAGSDHDSTSLTDDPWEGHPAVEEYFGDAFVVVHHLAELLADEGPTRGLIGPREVARLWERHLLNSAAVVPHVPGSSIADVGSGAGLPGLVVAAMRPDDRVTLIEPMERRVSWLGYAAEQCGLSNVVVVRARAEELKGQLTAEAITARAVAPVERLVKWCTPLLAPSGQMAFLKGRAAADEVERARHTLRRLGLEAAVYDAPTMDGVEPTKVVVVTRR